MQPSLSWILSSQVFEDSSDELLAGFSDRTETVFLSKRGGFEGDLMTEQALNFSILKLLDRTISVPAANGELTISCLMGVFSNGEMRAGICAGLAFRTGLGGDSLLFWGFATLMRPSMANAQQPEQKTASKATRFSVLIS